MDLDPAVVAAVITSLGLGSAGSMAINSMMQRKKIGADATVVVIAAARELVDPLRQELRNEREEHAREMDEKVMEIRNARISHRAEMDHLRATVAVLKQREDIFCEALQSAGIQVPDLPDLPEPFDPTD